MKQGNLRNPAGSSRSRNELYKIKSQQKFLRRREKDLKAEIIKDMDNEQVHKDADGKIEKVSRKPKRIYDNELLEAELKKHGLAETDIETIIEASTRKVEVSEYLSVTPKSKKL